MMYAKMEKLFKRVKSMRLLNSARFSKREVALFAILMVAIGGYFMYESFASAPGLYPTGANDIVFEKVSDGSYFITRDAVNGFQQLDARLYGNGNLICGNDSIESSPGKTIGTQITLSSGQITAFVNQVKQANFTDLPTQIIDSSQGNVRIGDYTAITLNQLSKSKTVVYFGGTKPSGFSVAEKAIKKLCQTATNAADIKKVSPANIPKLISEASGLEKALTGLRKFLLPDAYALWLDANAEGNQLSNVNSVRSSLGLNRLPVSGCLNSLASNWAVQMGQADQLYHNPNLGNQLNSGNCDLSRWSGAAENVGVQGNCENLNGNDTCSQALFDGFMNSCGHRDNIESKSATVNLGPPETCTNERAPGSLPLHLIGIGVYRDNNPGPIKVNGVDVNIPGPHLWVVQDYVQCQNGNCGTWAPETHTPSKLTINTTNNIPSHMTVINGHNIGYCLGSQASGSGPIPIPQTCSSGPTNNNDGSYNGIDPGGGNVTADKQVVSNGVTYNFTGWSINSGGTGGPCPGTNPLVCGIQMFQDQAPATITANYSSSSTYGGGPAVLGLKVAGGPTSATVTASTSSVGSCTSTIAAPTQCSSTGAIGPTTLTASSTAKDASGNTYNFSSWSVANGSGVTGVSCGAANCSVSLSAAQTSTLTANYTQASTSPSTLTVAVSGYTGTVTFNSYNHSVGNCDSTIPSSFTVTTTNNYGTRVCTSSAGNGIGPTDGLYLAPVVPSGYAFGGWTVSGTNNACTAAVPAGVSNTQCVNVPANGASATVTATLVPNQPASLTINTTGISYAGLKFSASPHDIGYCYGYTQGWAWPSANVCSSSAGNPIGPTTLYAPATYTDSTNHVWNFTGWSGYCTGTGGCAVNLTQGMTASVTANYALANSVTLYVYTSGSPVQVPINSTNHTLGNCNVNFASFNVNGWGGYATCVSDPGYGIGYSTTSLSGAWAYAPGTINAGGGTYSLSNWSGASWGGCASAAPAYSHCINMPPGSSSATISADYSYTPHCTVSGQYPEELCVAVNGGNNASSAYVSAHSAGTCGTSFAIPASCNGFQFGPPDGFYLYANSQPISGSTHSFVPYAAAASISPPSGTLSCYSTYCYVNYGNSSSMVGMITYYYTYQ